jgi:nucleolar complex protein 2
MVQKQKKSLKKFAKTRLTDTITKRRKMKPMVKEMRARAERKKDRTAREAYTEEASHQQQLRELEDEDKEFVDFLRREEPELLNFGDDGTGEANGIDADEDAGGDDDGMDAAAGPDEVITPEGVDRCYQNAFHSADGTAPTYSALRSAASTFRVAVHRLYIQPQGMRADPTFLVRTLQGAVKNFAPALDRFLGRTPGGTLPKKCAKYKQAAPVVRSFVTNCAAAVCSEGVEKVTIAYILHHLGELGAEYVGIFPLQLKRLLRVAFRSACDLEDQALRECSALFVRACVRRLGSSVREMCYKGMFLALMGCSRQYSVVNHEAITYVIQTIVDVYGIDLVLAYQTVFVYVKQLAMYLRTALLQSNDETAIRNLHNWQFVLALRTWAHVICEYSAENQLWPLVYPLVQVCLGLLDVFASSRTFPLHFLVFDIVNQISERCAVHIPLTPYLIRILSCPTLAQKSLTPGEDASQHHLPFMLRINKQAMKTVSYQTLVMQEILHQIARHTAAYAHTISFPETFAILHSAVKKFKKTCPRAHWSGLVAEYLKKATATEEIIRRRRANVSFGPCDDDQVKMWEAAIREEGKLPLVLYVQGLEKRSTESLAMMTKQSQGTRRRVTLEDVVEDEQETE